ncbi:MAG: tyrosine-type recombinase/integrase [bacterium]
MNIDKTLRDFTTFLSVDRGLSALSVEAYLNDINVFISFLKEKSLSDIVETDIIDFIKERRDVNKDRDTTLVRRLSSIQAFIRFLNQSGELKSNPMEMLDRPKVGVRLPKAEIRQNIELLLQSPYKTIEDKKKRGNLTESKQLKLLRDATMLELAYSSGLRASEIVNLRVGDVDLNGLYVRARGKGERERTIPIGEVARKKLEEYLAVRKEYTKDSPLFEGKMGKPISRNWFWYMVKYYARKVGIPSDISPHVIRHSFATHLLEGGADIKMVQTLLGHKMLSTTQIYTKITGQHLKEVIEKHPGS